MNSDRAQLMEVINDLVSDVFCHDSGMTRYHVCHLAIL